MMFDFATFEANADESKKSSGVYIGAKKSISSGGGGGKTGGSHIRVQVGKTVQSKSSSGGSSSGSRARTVVKANYIKGSQGIRKAKANARYTMTRQNATGDDQDRSAFTKNEDEINRRSVNALINTGDEKTYFYRMIIAPEVHNWTGADLKAVTRKTLGDLEKENGAEYTWAAVEHRGLNGHTDKAHIHVILMSSSRLARKDFSQLRSSSTKHLNTEIELVRSLQQNAEEGFDSYKKLKSDNVASQDNTDESPELKKGNQL